jgi:hypothetical protein
MNYAQHILERSLSEIRIAKANCRKGTRDRRIVEQYEFDVQHALQLLALSPKNSPELNRNRK